jgi:hypothetical protein
MTSNGANSARSERGASRITGRRWETLSEQNWLMGNKVIRLSAAAMADLTNWLTLFPDNTDEDSGAEVAVQRQERIRRAFESSKESYKNELVVLSPSFFRVEPLDAINTANNNRFGLQNIGRQPCAQFTIRI